MDFNVARLVVKDDRNVCVCMWMRGECESACQAPELLGESHTTLHLCSRRRRNSPSQQHRPCLFPLSVAQAPLPSQNPPLSELWAWSDTCLVLEVTVFNFNFSPLLHRKKRTRTSKSQIDDEQTIACAPCIWISANAKSVKVAEATLPEKPYNMTLLKTESYPHFPTFGLNVSVSM